MLFTHNPQTPNSTHTGEFVDANKELLKTLPPPVEALEYYNGNDMYLFDEFQVIPKIPKTKNKKNTKILNSHSTEFSRRAQTK